MTARPTEVWQNTRSLTVNETPRLCGVATRKHCKEEEKGGMEEGVEWEKRRRREEGENRRREGEGRGYEREGEWEKESGG